ncbi:Uncharacterised protein [Escherichia coli]|uniref:Uncharacterized protein n=1 Tax=Escherichia coli TaxID=562 RepID=A0A376ZJF8_ECOLX|nr:Uncharacterised protein [Escherichia coli]
MKFNVFLKKTTDHTGYFPMVPPSLKVHYLKQDLKPLMTLRTL